MSAEINFGTEDNISEPSESATSAQITGIEVHSAHLKYDENIHT